MGIKRWQLELLGALLMVSALEFFVGRNAIQLLPLLWLVAHRVVDSASAQSSPSTRVLATVTQLVSTTLAGFGFLIVIEEKRQFLPELPLPGDVRYGITFHVGLFCLLVYGLEEMYARATSDGAPQLVLRALLTMIMGICSFIGLAGTLVVLWIRLGQSADGPVSFGWMVWLLIAAGFIAPFYATWKLLQQNRYP
jgi:hypothetical protein